VRKAFGFGRKNTYIQDGNKCFGSITIVENGATVDGRIPARMFETL